MFVMTCLWYRAFKNYMWSEMFWGFFVSRFLSS